MDIVELKHTSIQIKLTFSEIFQLFDVLQLFLFSFNINWFMLCLQDRIASAVLQIWIQYFRLLISHINHTHMSVHTPYILSQCLTDKDSFVSHYAPEEYTINYTNRKLFTIAARLMLIVHICLLVLDLRQFNTRPQQHFDVR